LYKLTRGEMYVRVLPTSLSFPLKGTTLQEGTQWDVIIMMFCTLDDSSNVELLKQHYI